LCPHCSEPAVPDPKILNDILEMGVSGIGKNWRSPVGCDSCQGTGYRGRLGVYQMVPVDEKLKEMIVRGATLFEMQNHAAEMKYRNLYQDGLLKASKGETSVEELLRVLVTEDIV